MNMGAMLLDLAHETTVTLHVLFSSAYLRQRSMDFRSYMQKVEPQYRKNLDLGIPAWRRASHQSGILIWILQEK